VIQALFKEYLVLDLFFKQVLNFHIMKTSSTNKSAFQVSSRRGFIGKGGLLIASATMVGLSGMAISCNDQKRSGEEEKEN